MTARKETFHKISVIVPRNPFIRPGLSNINHCLAVIDVVKLMDWWPGRPHLPHRNPDKVQAIQRSPDVHFKFVHIFGRPFQRGRSVMAASVADSRRPPTCRQQLGSSTVRLRLDKSRRRSRPIPACETGPAMAGDGGQRLESAVAARRDDRDWWSAGHSAWRQGGRSVSCVACKTWRPGASPSFTDVGAVAGPVACRVSANVAATGPRVVSPCQANRKPRFEGARSETDGGRWRDGRRARLPVRPGTQGVAVRAIVATNPHSETNAPAAGPRRDARRPMQAVTSASRET